MITIQSNEVKRIFDRILDKLEQDNVKYIEIDTDWYRYIPSDQWENFDEDIIEVGSLNDDIDSLRLLLNDKQRICTYVDFDRLASLLRAISQERNPPL